MRQLAVADFNFVLTSVSFCSLSAVCWAYFSHQGRLFVRFCSYAPVGWSKEFEFSETDQQVRAVSSASFVPQCLTRPVCRVACAVRDGRCGRVGGHHRAGPQQHLARQDPVGRAAGPPVCACSALFWG